MAKTSPGTAVLPRRSRRRVVRCGLASLLSGCLRTPVFAEEPPTLVLVESRVDAYAEAAGNYRLSRDRIVSIGPLSEASGRPVFFDSATRRFGVLYPVSADDFVTGMLRSDGRVMAGDLRVRFVRDVSREVTALVWREEGSAPIVGAKVSPHRDVEIVFRNGEVTLYGTLTLPASPGAHPAIVLLQEAGPRRRPYGMWPYLLAGHGFATLTFDKRGVGDSTGDWQSASFDDLAGDALAAVALLRSRPDIDGGRIGLWGNSNSGWVLPLAASRSKDVAFMIDRVGSALPPTENVLYEIENQMHDQHFSDDDVAHALALRRLLQDAITTNSGWDRFAVAGAQARGEKWFPLSRTARYLAAQLPPDPATLRQWRAPLVFDPIPYWEQVTCPVLALFGELDKNTPSARNAPALAAALARAGNRDYTIVVLPGVDHPFYEYNTNRGDYVAEIPQLQRFVPGYVDGLINWLTARTR